MRKKVAGETIVEILIAMTIMVLIITSTYVILLRAMKTNTSIKNRVRALNIAREGVEGVRNIRDTNWLRYSGDRRNKWLCRPGINNGNAVANTPYTFAGPIPNTTLDSAFYEDNVILDFQSNGVDSNTYLRDCFDDTGGSAGEGIGSGYYVLEYYSPPDMPIGLSGNIVPPRYILEPQLPDSATANDIDTNREQFRLYWWNENAGFDRTTHAVSYYDLDAGPAATRNNEPSIFYRIVRLEKVPVYQDPTNPLLCLVPGTNLSPDPNCALEKLKVTVEVQWDEIGDGTDFEFVKLETHLFDYYERNSY